MAVGCESGQGVGRPEGGGGGRVWRAPYGHTDRTQATRWLRRGRHPHSPKDLQSRDKAKKVGAGKGNSRACVVMCSMEFAPLCEAGHLPGDYRDRHGRNRQTCSLIHLATHFVYSQCLERTGRLRAAKKHLRPTAKDAWLYRPKAARGPPGSRKKTACPLN